MKVIITGATGMVGKGVLLECLDRAEVTEVLSVSRSRLNMQHKKLKELIHKDFSEFKSIADQLKGYDAAYLCMGVSSAGKSEQEFIKFTYDYTLSLVNVLESEKENMVITYVSGIGTDSTEKGSTMWARVKGRTENAIIAKGFKGAFMYRPGVIIPLRGIKSSTKLYQFFYDYFLWAIKIAKKLNPETIVNTTQIGQSMINVALGGYSKNVLVSKDILETA